MERKKTMPKIILALSAAAFIGAASFASAQMTNSTGNYFGQTMAMDASNLFVIDLVTSSGAGTVGIYDFDGDTQGALLAEVPVNAGANSDVRINLGARPNNDVIAVLTVGGMVTATQQFEIN